jgi:hypothetical protein
METIKVTLLNGMVLEGTSSQVNETLKKLGYESAPIYYYSASKGAWVLIKDMNTTHLKNAILKYYTDWVKELHSTTNPQKLIAKILDGIPDPTFQNMLKEYATREEE